MTRACEATRFAHTNLPADAGFPVCLRQRIFYYLFFINLAWYVYRFTFSAVVVSVVEIRCARPIAAILTMPSRPATPSLLQTTPQTLGGKVVLKVRFSFMLLMSSSRWRLPTLARILLLTTSTVAVRTFVDYRSSVDFVSSAAATLCLFLFLRQSCRPPSATTIIANPFTFRRMPVARWRRSLERRTPKMTRCVCR